MTEGGPAELSAVAAAAPRSCASPCRRYVTGGFPRRLALRARRDAVSVRVLSREKALAPPLLSVVTDGKEGPRLGGVLLVYVAAFRYQGDGFAFSGSCPRARPRHVTGAAGEHRCPFPALPLAGASPSWGFSS